MFKEGDKVILKKSNYKDYQYIIEYNEFLDPNNTFENQKHIVKNASYGICTEDAQQHCNSIEVKWFDKDDIVIDKEDMFFKDGETFKCEIELYITYDIDNIISDLEKIENEIRI